MNQEFYETILSSISGTKEKEFSSNDFKAKSLNKIDLARNRSVSYAAHHRGQWFRPLYDFDEIQIAQDRDSYFSRSIIKKVNKLLNAGFEFTGMDDAAVKYIRKRFSEMEMATDTPLLAFFQQLYADLFRFNNCMVVKVRSRKASTGKPRVPLGSQNEIDPVAGYFILPFETLEFKANKNGSIKKVKQCSPDGRYKEFLPRDLIHFYSNKKPGYVIGTPEVLAALDDIQLLRRIEENVEELIETNLFPVYHYKVGNDMFPERVTPNGDAESDVVRRTVEYMPAAGVYISDHRHEIKAIGSEGRALRIDFYLNYFKQRVFSALGISPVDMGEGASANRSTASTMSKAMLMDIEAMAKIIAAFVDFYMINELLLEGGFDPLDENQKVHMKFGTIDKDEKRADENHLIQTFTSKVRDINEVRKGLGERPWTKENTELSYQKMFEEPLALVKSMTVGSAAGEVLAGLDVSNIDSASLKKAESYVDKQAAKQATASSAQPGQKGSASGAGSRSASAARNQPSNQHGTRSTAKTNRDSEETREVIIEAINAYDNLEVASLTISVDVESDTVEKLIGITLKRFEDFKNSGASLQTFAELAFYPYLENNNE